MKFNYLLIITAIAIAGVAAYFSVYGIAHLFIDAFLSVSIMAGVLEAGKLVVASFLKRHWQLLEAHLKWYFSTALIILMIITSLGIFSYLSNAYQGSTIEIKKINAQIEIYNSENQRLLAERERLELDKKTYVDALNQELAGLTFSDTTRYYDTKVRRDAFARYQPMIKNKEEEIKLVGNQLLEIQPKISDLKAAILTSGSDVGPLIAISDILDIEMDIVALVFIFFIIFVFDPLAVALVIASTQLYGVNQSQGVVTEKAGLIPSATFIVDPTKKFEKKEEDKPLIVIEEVDDKFIDKFNKLNLDEKSELLDTKIKNMLNSLFK